MYENSVHLRGKIGEEIRIYGSRGVGRSATFTLVRDGDRFFCECGGDSVDALLFSHGEDCVQINGRLAPRVMGGMKIVADTVYPARIDIDEEL